MRRCLVLLFIIITAINLFPGATQVKKQNSSSVYFQHNANRGLIALEGSLGHKLDVKWSEFNSTPAFISGKLTEPGYASSNHIAAGLKFISANRDLFGIADPEKELTLVNSQKDELGMTHVKYTQQINGIIILYSDVIVHFNQDGSIESINGNYVPTPVINLTPKITKETSIEIAKRKIKYEANSPKSALVIYHKNNFPVLAYEVLLPDKYHPNMKVYIDAVDGEVLKVDDGIRYDGPKKGSGVGLDGKVKQIDIYDFGGTYYLIDASLPMFTQPIDSLWGVIQTWDAKNDTTGNGYQSANFVIDPNGDNNFNDNEGLKAAVDAHYYTKIVYEFYMSHYNRNSFDNKGSSLINAVHYKDKYNNAFWNGAFMSYGDGDGVLLSNLAGALDVIGHEITHGVVQYTANLKYEIQPGAINESMADVFGVLMDSTDWQMGEDISTPAIPGDAMRNMSDPHNGQTYGDIMKGWQPEHMNEYMEMANDEDNDWGGVHVNSGIPNKAFYNVVMKIGHWKAGKIWYRALSVYLTQNSQFKDLVLACQTSAKDLYGDGSAELKAINDGFTAVGLITAAPPQTELTDMIYDDGEPATSVYEEYPMWQLGVRFSPTQTDFSVTQVQVYIDGDYYSNGTGQYKLGIYKADPETGLPGVGWLSPTNMIPETKGWQVYDIYGGGTYTGDFYVTVLYDGAGVPLIGADLPPGNGMAYEYDLTKRSWVKLLPPYDYTLFMRATIKTTVTTVEVDNAVPTEFKMEQNYPNPFNPSTTIKYALPIDTDVKITVYDLTGREVAELINDYQGAGSYSVTWNGKNASGSAASSGIYYYTMQAGEFVSSGKMCLVK